MGRILLVILVAAACVQPSVTECPTVDCPGEMVCDNQGGCVVPEQLAECRTAVDGDACSYTNLAKVNIEGTCASARVAGRHVYVQRHRMGAGRDVRWSDSAPRHRADLG